MTERDDRMAAFERRVDAIGEDVRVLKKLLAFSDDPNLHDLHDFLRRVADDHERRITGLEKNSGVLVAVPVRT